MGDATSSSENDASSGEGPNAKRRRRDPDAPKPDKGVTVLLDSDVSGSLNGQVRLPNTIEMAKLKKKENGQYRRINLTPEMTEGEVLSTLHSNFSIIRNKRLGCASATNGRLDFHGGKRIWNGAEIKKFVKGNSALYLFAEENHDSEDSQVLTGASVLAATKRLKELSQVHVSVSSTVDQRHVTGMGSTFAAVVSNANHEGEPEMLQRGEEDLTAQPDHTIDDILQQGLSVVQKRPNDPIVQATVDPAAQESLNPVSVTCKQRELIAQTSEQGSSLQQSPAVAAAHTNVPAKGFFSQTTSAKKLPVSARKRKSHPNGHQEFPVLVALTEGETTDSGIDSLLENESNHDTDQLRDIVLEISPSKGSTKGGDKFHIILQDICPLEMESFVAVFQFRETEQVHLKQTNLFTYTGITPKSLQGPGPVNVTLMSLDGPWWGGEAEFEYIDEDEEYLHMVVTNKDKRRKLFDRLHEELSNKQSDRQTSNSPGKTGPGLSSLNQSRCAWSVKLLQLLVYKAAEVGGEEFIQMIFSTSAEKVVFDSYRNNATLPEDVARVNGHLTLADYLQDVHNSLSKECNSDAGTEDIDWLELKHAVDKEQSLTSGTDDAQISEKCQPPGHPESDDDENDYFADDEMSPCSSPCLSPSYTNLRDAENEDHSQNTNMIEFLRQKEEYEEVNIPTENNDSSVFYPHLKVIPPIQGVNDGYEHKQLDYEEVESHRSEDDMHENKNVYRVFKTTQLYPALPSISSYRDTDDVVVTDVSEWGLDGHLKELRMTVNDETTRSRGSHEETPCYAAVMRNLESSFSRTMEIECAEAQRILELQDRVGRILERERAHDFDRLFPRDPAVSKMAAVDDCQKMQFWNGTHCVQCSGCPRSFGVNTQCSHKTDTECEACWPGYDYSNTTGTDSCILCDTYSNCLRGSSNKIMKEPTEPAMAPDKTRQASSIPSVENEGLWGVVSGTVVLLVAIAIAVAVAIYKRIRHATAAGERLINQQRRPLMASGLDLPISNLGIEGRRFITQRLNGTYFDGYFYWQACAEKCDLRAECESWKNAVNPAEMLLRAYGEKAGSTIRKLVEVLKDPVVDLTQIATEVEEKFSLPQDQGENENVVDTVVRRRKEVNLII